MTVNGRYGCLVNGIPVNVMAKHIYDPDKDGMIALAQLVSAVCSETEADNKIAAQNHPTVIRKTADEIVNNSSDFQDDDHLSLAVAANEVWYLFLYLRIDTSAVAGFRMRLSTLFGATQRGVDHFTIGTHSTDEGMAQESGLRTVHGGSGEERAILAWVLYIAGEGGGPVRLQWAQNTAEVSDTKILAGSFMVAHKLS